MLFVNQSGQKKLTPVERAQLIGAKTDGMKIKELVHQYCTIRSTVYNTLNKVNKILPYLKD